MKHIFIINPTSGHGSAKNAVPFIEEICQNQNLDFELIFTQYPGHAREIANDYTIADDVCLYSVGGDGTAYEILNGINDKVCMSIIPCGTGNDFYRMIGSQAKSIKERVQEAIDGKVVEVDYGVSNISRFLNCTTVGFDAEINHMVNGTMKKTFLPSKMMYPAAVVAKLTNPPRKKITIEIDGEVFEKEVLLFAIMNGRHYGGGFTPTPQADIQDGYFDICMVEPMPRRRIIPLLPKYIKGTHTELKECMMLKGKRIKITSNEPLVMQSDGEDFTIKSITFDLMRHGLKLKVPQSSKLNK